MPLTPSALHSLRRVFQTAFTVHDIAEPLVSFDDSTATQEIRKYLESNQLEIVGVRKGGRVEGYLELAELGSGECGKYMKSFDETRIILDSAPLVDLVLRLKECRRLFVSLLGSVGGIVSRSDFHKPPVRMWLFGMVTLIEMRFTRLIEQQCPSESWQPFLSAARVEKARRLLEERTRRNQDLALLDCLQLSDKAQIVARNQDLRELTRFRSRRQMEEATKMLERLRNNLTHSQDIVDSDWETIVSLAENLDRVLEGPPGLRDAEA